MQNEFKLKSQNKNKFVSSLEKIFFKGENYLFPPICYICGKSLAAEMKSSPQYICTKCLASLPFFPQSKFPRPDKFPKLYKTKSPWIKNDNFIYALFRYESTARAMLNRLKFADVKKYSRLFAHLASSLTRDLISRENKPPVGIIPLPTYSTTKDFTHLDLIAKFMAKELGIEIVTAVVRTKNTADLQKNISSEEREIFYSDAFELNSDFLPAPYRGQKLILLADLFISGTELSSCAKTLTAAGLDLIYLVIAARLSL